MAIFPSFTNIFNDLIFSILDLPYYGNIDINGEFKVIYYSYTYHSDTPMNATYRIEMELNSKRSVLCTIAIRIRLLLVNLSPCDFYLIISLKIYNIIYVNFLIYL